MDDRLSNGLHKSHRDFDPADKRAAGILSSDPYNRTRQYHIKKLECVPLAGSVSIRVDAS